MDRYAQNVQNWIQRFEPIAARSAAAAAEGSAVSAGTPAANANNPSAPSTTGNSASNANRPAAPARVGAPSGNANSPQAPPSRGNSAGNANQPAPAPPAAGAGGSAPPPAQVAPPPPTTPMVHAHVSPADCCGGGPNCCTGGGDASASPSMGSGGQNDPQAPTGTSNDPQAPPSNDNRPPPPTQAQPADGSGNSVPPPPPVLPPQPPPAAGPNAGPAAGSAATSAPTGSATSTDPQAPTGSATGNGPQGPATNTSSTEPAAPSGNANSTSPQVPLSSGNSTSNSNRPRPPAEVPPADGGGSGDAANSPGPGATVAGSSGDPAQGQPNAKAASAPPGNANADGADPAAADPGNTDANNPRARRTPADGLSTVSLDPSTKEPPARTAGDPRVPRSPDGTIPQPPAPTPLQGLSTLSPVDPSSPKTANTFTPPQSQDSTVPDPSKRVPAAVANSGSLVDIAVGGLTGTLGGVANVLTLGIGGQVAQNWDKGPVAVLKAVGNQIADVATLGAWKGWQEGGLSGAVAGVANTLLPTKEAATVGTFVQESATGQGDTVSWDQAAGAAGAGFLKLVTLGRAGGSLLGSRAMTPAEIEATQYGYHQTRPANVPGIFESGLEARSPGSQGGLRGAANQAVGAVKGAISNEPPKAAYMFGAKDPGLAGAGDLSFSNPPVVVDLRKVDPSQLRVWPLDGAIMSTGDVPPSALVPYGQVPVSPTPYRGSFDTLPTAGSYLAGNRAADEAGKAAQPAGGQQ